jgi:hypothetical protein
MVDVIRALGVQVSERVVRDAGQVNHRVEPAQRLDRHVAHIVGQGRKGLGRRSEIAGGEQIRVETNYLMARPVEHWTKQCADVTRVPSEQNLHACLQ